MLKKCVRVIAVASLIVAGISLCASAAEDMAAFSKKSSTSSCSECHSGMGYGFIEVVKLASPPDQGIKYKMTSKAADVTN